jgi:hypothetical protein
MEIKMKLKPKAIEITKEKLRGKEDEVFKSRELYAEKITRLVKNIDDGLTISLNAEWGEGKTIFLKMWKAILEKEKIKCIYFDAFKSDYNEDPFLAISSQILDTYSENLSADSNFKKSVGKIAIATGGFVAKTVINFITAGVVKGEQLDELGAEIAKSVSGESSKLIDSFVDDKLKEHKEMEKSIEDMRKALAQIVQSDLESKGKLVFIIDELDRCKPCYSIKTLEIIKHFFEVEGVFFVLAINKDQIIEYIKGQYGIGVDANRYLQKFINLEIKLPKKIIYNGYEDDIYNFCKSIYDAHEFIKRDGSAEKINLVNDHLLYTAVDFFRYFNLTLREIEDVYRKIVIYLSTGGTQILTKYPTVFFFAITIKIKNAKLYDKIKKGLITHAELVEELKYLSENKTEKTGMIEGLMLCLKVLLSDQVVLDENEKLLAGGFEVHYFIEKDIETKKRFITGICERIDFLD